MKNLEKYREAYQEAKDVCLAYKEFKGDKRSSVYRKLRIAAFTCFIARMNNFGKKLGLPTFEEYFYNN